MPEYKFPVRAADGSRGTLYQTSRFLDDRPRKLVRLEDGREFLVPAEHLRSRGDDVYYLDLTAAELERYGRVETAPRVRQAGASEPVLESAEAPVWTDAPPARAASDAPPARAASDAPPARAASETVIPAAEEQLRVDRREVETGRVLVHKHVEETDAVVDTTVRKDEYDVRCVPVNRLVDGPVDVRQEGDTTIVPLLEEVLVVEKRLILREEVHITRRREEVREERTVPVRRENVEVERVRFEEHP